MHARELDDKLRLLLNHPEMAAWFRVCAVIEPPFFVHLADSIKTLVICIWSLFGLCSMHDFGIFDPISRSAQTRQKSSSTSSDSKGLVHGDG
jgi:hypothetical protein